MDYKEENIKKTEELILERMVTGNLAKKRHENIANLVSKYANKNGSIFEIGVREGFLFDYLKEAGFNDLYGIDISPLAIKILHERGYKGHVADAQEGFNIYGKWDTIIISHCLEHVPEPNKVINNIYEALKINGILYIEVPIQPKEKVPTKWSHYYCFESYNELLSFFNEKWNLIYNEKKPKNFKCIFEKVS